MNFDSISFALLHHTGEGANVTKGHGRFSFCSWLMELPSLSNPGHAARPHEKLQQLARYVVPSSSLCRWNHACAFLAQGYGTCLQQNDSTVVLDTVPYSAGGAWAVNLWMKPGSTYGSDFQYLFSHAEDKYYSTGWESNQASPLVSAVLHLWLSGVCTHITHTASCPSPNCPRRSRLAGSFGVCKPHLHAVDLKSH